MSIKKSIFITGGTTGLGLELAHRYLLEGCRVAVCGRNLAKLPENYQEKYPGLIVYECDVTDHQKLKSIIQEFSQEGLDIIVANAGISVNSKIDIPNFEDGRRVMDINVMGVLNTLEPALDYMMPRKQGHLVVISSVASFMGLPGASFYCASKAAVRILCETYTVDLKKYGIDVSCICPGFIQTPLTDRNKHSMPFLLSLDKGVTKIKKAIDRKAKMYVFPWQMNIASNFLGKIPRWLYRAIIKLPPFNYNKNYQAKNLAVFLMFLLMSCNADQNVAKKEEVKPQVIQLQKSKPVVDPTKSNSIQVQAPDDFSDFEKKEEKCDTEEEQLKKEFEQKKSNQAAPIKLQGGSTTGCKIN